MAGDAKPIVLITGAASNIGRSLAAEFADGIPGRRARPAGKSADLTSADSLAEAFAEFRQRFGTRIASVIHLVACIDFTGEESPLYQSVNVEGTKHLLRRLQAFQVEQFVYANTLLVHAPGRPGEAIDEEQPIEPGWAYPKSKAAAEEAIVEEHGGIPYVILRLAGLYDEPTSVPTLANQIAHIHQRDLESYFYWGSTLAGQAMVHREDMLAAFRRAVDRRKDIPSGTAILIGEPDAMGYDALQDEIGYLLHGAEDWPTIRLPKPLAAAGALAQAALEPVVPDALDQGEKPFIGPFMVAPASTRSRSAATTRPSCAASTAPTAGRISPTSRSGFGCSPSRR
jgi:nucleoside-diphosphate-sugar epimerase